MSQENVEVANAFDDAYNARDSEALERLLHPKAEITTVSTRGGWAAIGVGGRRDNISSSSTRRGPASALRSRTIATSVGAW
jgi:hypothetical protein